MNEQDYRELIKQRVLDESSFVRLTLAGKVRGPTPQWQRIVVRPVQLKQGRHLQFSYFDQKQDTTKNYQGPEAEAKLDEILAIPFSSVHVQSTTGDLRVQLTKSGRAIIHRERGSAEPRAPDLAHNRTKDVPLPAGRPDPLLQEIGIMNQQGAVIASMQDKYTQINEFLKLLDHTGYLDQERKEPLHILDCGCGSAYLSMATYHYLNNIRGIRAELTGVDINQTLIDKSAQHGKALRFDDICFRTSTIADYVPPVEPDIVLALHACNTATDDAIMQGILHDAGLILVAPCCHHELHESLRATAPFEPIFQHGILRQRLGDILTDTFRALILRILGYKTDVVEFVSPEHTDRNLLIRAVRRGSEARPRHLQEYHALKSFWQVTPYLEQLLAQRGRPLPTSPDLTEVVDPEA
jgi:SAM-dependent methyltransferase